MLFSSSNNTFHYKFRVETTEQLLLQLQSNTLYILSSMVLHQQNNESFIDLPTIYTKGLALGSYN